MPNVHIPTVYEAMNQVDEILNPNVCDFTMTDSSTLQPSQVSGYNLALITAQLVAETVQQVAQVIPPVAGGTLRSDITFRASFAASLEAEQDIPGFGQKIVRAASVALARKIGQFIVAGRRGADMSGIATQLSPSVSNGSAGKLTLTDVTNFYFTMNRFYRRSPKCAWLVDDAATSCCVRR